jgi:hypothetical protein
MIKLAIKSWDNSKQRNMNKIKRNMYRNNRFESSLIEYVSLDESIS